MPLIALIIALLSVYASTENLQSINQISFALYHSEVFQLYIPWITLLVIFKIMLKIVFAVRMRKEGIVILGLLFQLFLPIPYADQTPKIEQLEIKKNKKLAGNKLVQKSSSTE